jgi:hypothetical protein
VDGHVVEAKIVGGAFFGYDDFATRVPAHGDVGAHGTEFGPFGDFHRGYFIVDTDDDGFVALVAAGLNTISSVNFNARFSSLQATYPSNAATSSATSSLRRLSVPGDLRAGALQLRCDQGPARQPDRDLPYAA